MVGYSAIRSWHWAFGEIFGSVWENLKWVGKELGFLFRLAVEVAVVRPLWNVTSYLFPSSRHTVKWLTKKALGQYWDSTALRLPGCLMARRPVQSASCLRICLVFLSFLFCCDWGQTNKWWKPTFRLNFSYFELPLLKFWSYSFSVCSCSMRVCTWQHFCQI